MTMKITLFAITAAAITLGLSGCDGLLGTDDMDTAGDDMSPALPHIGTWYFADPDPADDIPVPPDARLVLGEIEFTLAMGDEMGTAFTLFETPDVTKFKVTGTYTIGADGASFSLPDPPTSAITVEPAALQMQIARGVVIAAAALQEDATAMIMIDVVATPSRVTISGSFLPELLNLPGVTAVTACKDKACPANAGS